MAARRADPPHPPFEARTRAEWREWLESNHDNARGVWLVSFKKSSGEPHLAYGEAVEEALCFGWVDSLPRKLDEKRSMLLVTPRKDGSSWSKRNKERAERLIAEGRMAPAGQAKVEAVKRDGAWDRLNEAEALTVPADLAAAFKSDRRAEAHFKAFPPSSRRGILEWILNAKRPETRAKRVEDTVRLAGQISGPITIGSKRGAEPKFSTAAYGVAP